MFWDLIVIGRGSAAAYYLATVDRSMFPNILVIGTPDPWGGERGYNKTASTDPVNFVNHTWQMIAHLSTIFPEFDTALVDRIAFARANEGVIDSCATQVVLAKVVGIEELSELATSIKVSRKGYYKVFQVTTDPKGAHVGKKIVVATGAGVHRVPDEVKKLAAPDKIMDMDAFGRMAGAFSHPEKMTVFVQGPNAAIDSVETAKFQKFNVCWLIKKAKAGPAILATPHQVYARDALKNNKVEYPEHPRGTPGFTVELTGATPPIKVTVPGQPRPLLGDLFVYGMGQEPKDAMDGIVPAEFRNRLQPIYDINQRFGAAHETVVGLKLENSDWASGFEVIGALATQVARGAKVPHTYKKELAERIDEVRAKVLPFLTGALVQLQTSILLKPLGELEKMSPGDVRMQIKNARSWVEGRYPSWKDHINALTSLMLNYVTVARYFEGKENVGDADLSSAARILTPSVIQGPQLGVIRSQTAAQNGAIPGYVGSQVTAHETTSSGPPKYLGVAAQSLGNRVNFSHDDPTVLRVYIALNFPFVLEEDAQPFIARVLSRRGDTATLKGYGYGPAESKGFETELKALNAKGMAALTSAKVTGTGRT